MTAKFSTGLRNAMLGTSSFKAAFDDALLRLYSGSPPATADAAATGTLLCQISAGGDPLTFGTPAAGVVSKTPSETWSGTVLESGTVGYFRLVNDSDDDTSSASAMRVQGSVAAAGADLNMTNPTVTEDATQPINNFAVALPTL